MYKRIIILIFFAALQATAQFASAEGEKSDIWDVVTVIGSQENEASLPGSGDLVTTEQIRNHSYDDVNKILRRVPGVYLREEDGYGLFPNISLRGSDPARSQKVTILEDGITQAPAPYSAPSAYYSPTAGRMSAVEVLKGSSQVKYGPHTTGGVVNYISTPIPNKSIGYMKQSGGSNREVRNHTYVGGTKETDLGKFGVLVEHYYRQNQGFKEIDTTPDFDESEHTGFFKTEPMVKISWEPAGSERYQRLEAKFGYSDIRADETYLGLNEADFEAKPTRRYSSTRFDHIDTEQVRNSLRYFTEVTDDVTVGLTGYYNRFQRNWKKLHNISGGAFSTLSEALAAGGTSLAILRGEAAGTLNVRNNNREYDQWGFQKDTTFDFDLAGTSHNVEFGTGYHRDYVRRQQNTESYTQNASGNITGFSSTAPGTAGNRKQEAWAIRSYIRDNIEIGNLTVTPGFRYEYLNLSYTDFNTSGNPSLITARGGDDLKAIAGGVGFNYRFSDELSAFTGVHQGFSTPGPRSNVRNDIVQETSLTKELGVRFIEDGPWEAEMTYFHTDFDDLLVVDNIGGSGSGTTENVGDIISQGIELKSEYDLGKALKKDFRNPYYVSFTWTHARLDGDSNSTDPESLFSGGKDGNKVPYVPDLQLAFGTGLEWKKWGVFLDATYVGETFTTASNVDDEQRPTGTPDARFGMTDEFLVVDLSGQFHFNENGKVFLNLQNIANQEYIVSRHPHGPRPGRPFTFLAGVELDF